MNIRKTRRPLLMTAAFFAMGFTLPSCPGQEAMQQQIDSLQQKNMELARKLSTVEQTNKKLSDDMAKVSQVLQEMTGAIGSQKTALDTLSEAVKQLQAKAATPSPSRSKGRTPPPKRRH